MSDNELYKCEDCGEICEANKRHDCPAKGPKEAVAASGSTDLGSVALAGPPEIAVSDLDTLRTVVWAYLFAEEGPGGLAEIEQAAEVDRVISEMNAGLVLDDLSKVPQLDGSLPWVAVPQQVLARLMAGADCAVQYLKHVDMTRDLMDKLQENGGAGYGKETMARVILKGRELESKARIAHGLDPLPPLLSIDKH